MFVAIYLLGGWGSLLWAGCLRTVWVYHITWFVNSAAHVWGTQTYETGEAGGREGVALGGDLQGEGQGEPGWRLAAAARMHASETPGEAVRLCLLRPRPGSAPPPPPRARPAAAGDQSRNNWWVGLLGFGEGWHNNHHAFEFSARHGLEDSQWDMTWQVIRFLDFLGLADNIKLPSEKQKERLRLEDTVVV